MRRHARALIAVFAAMLALGASAALALQTHPHEASRDLNGAEDFTGDPDTVPAGSFCCLGGLAVDQTNGDLYFAEGATPPNYSFGSVYRYDASGAYQSVFDVSETLANPQDVAIDSSGTASDGTLYVTDTANNRIAAIDTTSGSLVATFGTTGRINGVEDSPGDPDTVPTAGFSSPCGVAVDQANGNLFVADQGNNRIWIFDSSGAYQGRVADSILSGPCGLAFDSTGRLYVRNANDGKVLRFDRASATDYVFGAVFYPATEGGASDVAVDPSNDHVYVDRGDRIVEYDAGGSPVSTFGQGTICCSGGLAVDSASGRTYASEFGSVKVFGALLTLPEASTGPASDITGTSATISGTIDPIGGPAADCEFEYGSGHVPKSEDLIYDQSAPCDPAGPFASTEAVTALLTGLAPATGYHYRLRATSSEGTVVGENRTFATNGPPVIDRFFATEVSGSTATLQAAIKPAGLDTSYRFEYTTQAEFEADGFANATQAPIPDGEIAPISDEEIKRGIEENVAVSSRTVSQDIVGLTSATTYRFRVVAENAIDEVASDAKAFRTFPPHTSAPGQFPGQGFLPDNRAWEMVSPPEKLGADVNTVSTRIRIAEDGSAVAFSSLGGFADVAGTGVTGEYLAERTREAGTNGWSTHGIMPPQAPLSEPGVGAFIDPRYFGDFSADLDRGVVFTRNTVSDDPDVANVPNLYLRTDLRSKGKGTYKLLTDCPRCEEEEEPFPAPNRFGALYFGSQMDPYLADVTPDLTRGVFELRRRLTADTPPTPSCNPDNYFVILCSYQAYESDGEEVHHVGRIPVSPAISCDDAGGPACEGAAISRIGSGVYGGDVLAGVFSTPDTISDGSDGHTRVFFTFPTQDGQTPNINPHPSPGNVYARIDNTQTVQLNASERTDCAGDPSCGGDNEPDPAPASFGPAQYQGATPDGDRAFFSTTEALTDDAPGTGLYMYDLTKPASDPHNLTFIDKGNASAIGLGIDLVGYSDDGHYVYFSQDDSIGLWHDGEITPVGGGEMRNRTVVEWGNSPRTARVTPDGRHLLFSNGGQLNLYSADEDRLQCASCNPTGALTTEGVATNVIAFGPGRGVTRGDPHETTTLSDDGRYVFFSSNERLVAADRNGPCKGVERSSNPPEKFPCTDAYVFDSVTGEVSLLSSGESSSTSLFLESPPVLVG